MRRVAHSRRERRDAVAARRVETSAERLAAATGGDAHAEMAAEAVAVTEVCSVTHVDAGAEGDVNVGSAQRSPDRRRNGVSEVRDGAEVREMERRELASCEKRSVVADLRRGCSEAGCRARQK